MPFMQNPIQSSNSKKSSQHLRKAACESNLLQEKLAKEAEISSKVKREPEEHTTFPSGFFKESFREPEVKEEDSEESADEVVQHLEDIKEPHSPLFQREFSLFQEPSPVLTQISEKSNNTFEEAEVKTDRAKKKFTTIYIDDSDLKAQWQAIAEFQTGTYTSFKKAVLALYPQAECLMRGSRKVLDTIFSKFYDIPIHDLDQLSAMIMAIQGEVAKLKLISEARKQPVITDNELTQKFLGCLSGMFQQNLKMRLVALYTQKKIGETAREALKKAREAAVTNPGPLAEAEVPLEEDTYKKMLDEHQPIEQRFTFGELVMIAQIVAKEHSVDVYSVPSMITRQIVPVKTEAIAPNYGSSLFNWNPSAGEATKMSSIPEAPVTIKQEPKAEIFAFRQYINEGHVNITKKVEEQWALMKQETEKQSLDLRGIRDQLQILTRHPQAVQMYQQEALRVPQSSSSNSAQYSSPRNQSWNQDGNDSWRNWSREPFICYFYKGSGHTAERCFERARYIKEGKIHLENGGVYVTHSNERVTNTVNGVSQKEKVDKALASRSVNMFESYQGGSNYQEPAPFVTSQDFHEFKGEISDKFDVLLQTMDSWRRPGPAPTPRPPTPKAEAPQAPSVNTAPNPDPATMAAMMNMYQQFMQNGGQQVFQKIPEIDEESDTDSEMDKEPLLRNKKKAVHFEKPTKPRQETSTATPAKPIEPPQTQEDVQARGRGLHEEQPFKDVPSQNTIPIGIFKPVELNTTQNVPRKEELPNTERRVPAFRKCALVEDEAKLTKVIKELWNLELPITVRALASISTGAHKYLKRMLKGEPSLAEKRLAHYLLASPEEEHQVWMNTISLLDQVEDIRVDKTRKLYEETENIDIRLQNFLSVEELPWTQVQVADGNSTVINGSKDQ
ncbi:hypothetical protein FA15DRAFT_662021, partial [Coprinopsis marcescibilis]